MKPSILLRVASGMFAFFAVAHSAAMFAKSRGPAEDLVMHAMRAYHFDVMGSNRTHFDFYRGEGFYLSVLGFLIAVLLWQLASASRTYPAAVRPVLWTLLAASVASSVLNFMFFFIAPLVTSIIATVCIALALFSLSKPAAAQVA